MKLVQNTIIRGGNTLALLLEEASNFGIHLSTRAKYLSYSVLVVQVLAKSFISAADGSGEYLIRSGRKSIDTNTTYRCTLRRWEGTGETFNHNQAPLP
jgi:hypothetical protein